VRPSSSPLDLPDPHASRLALRLGARRHNAPLLRAHLRLWLEQTTVSDAEIDTILTRSTEAFTAALATGQRLRPLAVTIDATDHQGHTKLTITTPTAPPNSIST
jgi:hypothetical protein